jgi:hypothetical protein
MIEMAAAKPAGARKTPLTVEQIRAAERAKILADALSIQRQREQMEAAAAHPVTEETARVLRAFDRLERGHSPTPDEQASAQAERQRQESMARSVAAGYSEWEPLLDDHGEARLRELRQQQRKVP